MTTTRRRVTVTLKRRESSIHALKAAVARECSLDAGHLVAADVWNRSIFRFLSDDVLVEATIRPTDDIHVYEVPELSLFSSSLSWTPVQIVHQRLVARQDECNSSRIRLLAAPDVTVLPVEMPNPAAAAEGISKPPSLLSPHHTSASCHCENSRGSAFERNSPMPIAMSDRNAK
jgi:hypothetical protein